MATELLLGIDVGTTSVKAGLFSADGDCVGIGRQEYQLDTPATDRVQIDPEVYWRACRKTVREALARFGGSPDRVCALAISSQGETTITLDAQGKAIYPALVWLDNRASIEAAFLAKRFNSEVYAHTGIPEILPTWSACKILWIRHNEPDVFACAAKFLLVQDYLIYRLTGRIVTDGSISCGTLNYDLVKNGWWMDILQAVGISTSQLPEIVNPGTNVGVISREAALELGLSTRTIVVTGGMDQAVCAIGAGNFKPGIVSETTGAALTIQVTTTDPMIDRSKAVPVYRHSAPGQYLFIPVCPTAGIALKWLRDSFFQDEIKKAEEEKVDAYERLTSIAESVAPGSGGLVMLPHLMGAFSPEPNIVARGSFTGFTLSHTRAHFVRALLEAVAFLLKRNLEHIEQTGLKVREIRATGGGARSRLWNQIKADVCNRTVLTLANEETGLLGDAILAAVAAGIFPSIADGCREMVAVKERIQPGAATASYVEPYRMYCELDRRLSDYYKQTFAQRG